MIVDTVPTENFVGGETAEVSVVAGRIGPEQSAEASPVADAAIAAQPEATQATPSQLKNPPKSQSLKNFFGLRSSYLARCLSVKNAV